MPTITLRRRVACQSATRHASVSRLTRSGTARFALVPTSITADHRCIVKTRLRPSQHHGCPGHVATRFIGGPVTGSATTAAVSIRAPLKHRGFAAERHAAKSRHPELVAAEPRFTAEDQLDGAVGETAGADGARSHDTTLTIAAPAMTTCRHEPSDVAIATAFQSKKSHALGPERITTSWKSD